MQTLLHLDRSRRLEPAKLVLLVLTAGLLSACYGTTSPELRSTRRDISSGHMGCPPAEVILADEEDRTWTAECRGKRAYCVAGKPPKCTEETPPR